jgi:hypothetical protein
MHLQRRASGRLLAVCSQGAALQWGRQLRSGRIKWQTRSRWLGASSAQAMLAGGDLARVRVRSGACARSLTVRGGRG